MYFEEIKKKLFVTFSENDYTLKYENVCLSMRKFEKV